MSDFHVDIPSIALKPRKDGVSGMLRVRNDAEFLTACVESCLPALDELVIVYNNCTDNSPELIKALAEKYPSKIKAYEYTPKILAWNLSPKQAEDVLNGQIPAENTLAGYYNYALSKTTCKYVMKIDADQIYFTDKLKIICDLYRTAKHPKCILKDIAVVVLIKAYLSIAYRLKRNSKLFSNKRNWRAYSYALSRIIASRKTGISLSGINIVTRESHEMPLVSLGKEIDDGANIMPPYNGEGDHPIFRVTEKTYFIPYRDDAYNRLNHFGTSVIERLLGLGRLIPAGIYWFHLNACRKTAYEKTASNVIEHPTYFTDLESFAGLPLFNTLKKNRFEMITPQKSILFDFIHNDLDISTLNRAIAINKNWTSNTEGFSK